MCRGGSRGGGPGGQDPPPFWGTPKLHKEGKNGAACARKLHVLVLNSYPDPLLPKNPVSAPGVYEAPAHHKLGAYTIDVDLCYKTMISGKIYRNNHKHGKYSPALLALFREVLFCRIKPVDTSCN